MSLPPPSLSRLSPLGDVEAPLESPLRAEAGESLRLLDLAEVVLAAVDCDGRIQYANRRASQLLQRSPENLRGERWAALFVRTEERPRAEEDLYQLLRMGILGEEARELSVEIPEGGLRTLRWSAAALRDDQGQVTGALLSGVDITAQVRAQRALQRSRQMLEAARAALDEAALVVVLDDQGAITYANEGFAAVFQEPAEALIGRLHRDLLRSSAEDPGLASPRWRGEVCYADAAGCGLWADMTFVPLRGPEGASSQRLGIGTDITERKRAEERLRQQETLVRLGEMAAVVAHQVKNPLAATSGVLQVLASRSPAESPHRRRMEEVLARLQGLDATLRDLLAFARSRQIQRQPVALGALLARCVQEITEDPQFPQIAAQVEGEEPVLSADPELLGEALHHLLHNAAQAMDGKGTIHVDTWREGGGWAIAVRDEGPGIPPEAQARLFQPFFTTRTRGTGLGLVIVQRAAEAHGGHVTVDAPPGGGATFTLWLPA